MNLTDAQKLQSRVIEALKDLQIKPKTCLGEYDDDSLEETWVCLVEQASEDSGAWVSVEYPARYEEILRQSRDSQYARTYYPGSPPEGSLLVGVLVEDCSDSDLHYIVDFVRKVEQLVYETQLVQTAQYRAVLN